MRPSIVGVFVLPKLASPAKAGVQSGDRSNNARRAVATVPYLDPAFAGEGKVFEAPIETGP